MPSHSCSQGETVKLHYLGTCPDQYGNAGSNTATYNNIYTYSDCTGMADQLYSSRYGWNGSNGGAVAVFDSSNNTCTVSAYTFLNCDCYGGTSSQRGYYVYTSNGAQVSANSNGTSTDCEPT